MSAIMDAAFETYWMMRIDYELHHRSRFLRAHTELRGEQLNAAGRAAHIDPASLFLGPRSRVDLYASEELKARYAEHGRLTIQEFETQWWNGRVDGSGALEPMTLAKIA